MNERVKLIRKELGLTLDKFGERLGVGKNAISRIETGKSNLTNQMFKSICREFHVNPDYLQNGTGDMFLNIETDDVIIEWVGRVLGDKPDSFQKRVISMMSTWTKEEWAWLEKQARAIIRENETKDTEPDIPSTPEEFEKKYTILEHQNSEDKTAG